MNVSQNNRPQASATKQSGLILTPQQKSNLKKQYMVWTKQAIKQMQKNATNNVTQRIPIMLCVANAKTKAYQTAAVQLTITEQEQSYIVNKVHSEIATWNGIQIGTCKSEKKQFVDYSHTARNWFNRNKSKIYGNHLFYPIIFVKIYQWALNLPDITADEKIVLFVDILHAILHSTVQFKRSKAHPLIPHQTFIQPNLFTTSCLKLCTYYNAKCDLSVMQSKRQQLPNGQYAKNRDRSKDINNAFICKIEQIKKNILYKNVHKPLPNFNNLNNVNYDNKCNQNKLNDNYVQTIARRKYKVPQFNKNSISDHQCQTCTLGHNQNSNDQTSSTNNADHIHNNTSNKQITPIAINHMNNNAINSFNIMSLPMTTNRSQPVQSDVNYFNYLPNRGQNNLVSQARYSPLLSTPYINIAVNPNLANDGTVTVSLHNMNQPQTMQFVSLLYGSTLQ